MRRLPHDEVSRIAGIMRGEAQRRGRIVSDLLDLSRIERGLPLPLHRAPLAVESVIATTAEVFRRGSGTHPVVVEYAAGLPRVDADPDALERILINLISNAMKYSPPAAACGGAPAESPMARPSWKTRAWAFRPRRCRGFSSRTTARRGPQTRRVAPVSGSPS